MVSHSGNEKAPSAGTPSTVIPQQPTVKQETAEEAEEAGPSSSLPHIDMESVFSAILNTGPTQSTLPIATVTPRIDMKPVVRTPKPESFSTTPGRQTRMKVFADGFFMTFDKVSSCGQKYFWRCEFKNTCRARMHTDLNNETIISHIHEHNHDEPSAQELMLYGMIKDQIEPNKVYSVRPIQVNCASERRRLRKAAFQSVEAQKKRRDAEAQKERKKLEEAITIAVTEAMKTATGGPNGTLTIDPRTEAIGALYRGGRQVIEPKVEVSDETLLPVSPLDSEVSLGPNSPSTSTGQRKRRYEEVASDPDFEQTYEITKRIIKLCHPQKPIKPEEPWTPPEEILLYVSNSDEVEEQTYFPIHLKPVDELTLRKQLEKFAGKTCPGRILLTVAPKINIVVHKELIETWENGKFLRLDTSRGHTWKLSQANVDDEVTAATQKKPKCEC